MKNHKGFSLLELLMALAITLCIFMVGFRLFLQNERAFQDQYLISAMQQTARAVTFQISEEIRSAGQGVPAYEAGFDSSDNEGVAVILTGSDDTHLRFRASRSNVEASVSSTSVNFFVNSAVSVVLDDAAVFSTALGTSSPTGRFVYIGGPTSSSCWGWTRAALTAISAGTNTVTLRPSDSGDGCRTSGGAVVFVRPQRIVLEECLSLYSSSGSVWQATASDMTDETNPSWAAASELGRNFTALTFTYYDDNDLPLIPSTLANRLAVARVDVNATVQTAAALSNGSQPTFALAVRSIPVNVQFR